MNTGYTARLSHDHQIISVLDILLGENGSVDSMSFEPVPVCPGDQGGKSTWLPWCLFTAPCGCLESCTGASPAQVVANKLKSDAQAVVNKLK